MGDVLFREGLIQNNLEMIRNVSKADVHNHIGLGMRFDTFNDYVGGILKKPPQKMNGIQGLDEYIFNETVLHIKNGNDVNFLIEATIKEAIYDHVKILEASIDCHDVLYYENPSDLYQFIKNIKIKYQKQIDFRPELGMPKSISKKHLDELLIPCINSGVYQSLDLYGDETKDDFLRFKPYYQYAKEKGLKLKVHAGEFLTAKNVFDAITILEPDEIQHGIGCITSDKVMDLIKERGIRLNLGISSNLILGAVSSIHDHPIKKLFDKKIKLTISTDDLLLFNQSVSEEFLLLYQAGLLNVDELNEIRLNGLM